MPRSRSNDAASKRNTATIWRGSVGRPEFEDRLFAAMAAGVPVEGVCLYPIVNHPGWDDDRHCYNGMFDYADGRGNREVYEPLAEEVAQDVGLAGADGAAHADLLALAGRLLGEIARGLEQHRVVVDYQDLLSVAAHAGCLGALKRWTFIDSRKVIPTIVGKLAPPVKLWPEKSFSKWSCVMLIQ